MLFNSYLFLFVFLPVSLGLYYFLRTSYGKEASFVVLVLASLIYYAYWKIIYLPILLISIVGNYGLGLSIARSGTQKRKKIFLILGIALNLCALAYYKYANFFLDNLETITGTSYSSVNILLPLAISFFTFQQIAYLVDNYKNEAKEYKFVHYCLFVSFFPQLIAGPIVHHKEMLPQFMAATRKLVDVDLMWQGIQQFCYGLFKKVMIADNIALYATPVFMAADGGHSITAWEAWIAALAYTFQLYFDFSAYSDMAIGIGKMFGINLPKNFNSPYKASSISDFWRRWHITLSHFLRDYLYIAMGGNKKGSIRRYSNLFVTMVLGGLWHGASWNFVVWGVLHGLYLIINHAWSGLMRLIGFNTKRFWYKTIAQVLTFFVVVEAWVLFRAETFEGAAIIYEASYQFSDLTLSSLFGESFNYINDPVRALMMLSVCGFVAFILPNSQDFIENKQSRWFSSSGFVGSNILIRGIPLLAATVLMLSIASMNKVSEFLYFQF